MVFNLAIAQHKSGIESNSVPGSSGAATLGSAPTSGNLLIAVVGCNIALSSVTANLADWTPFALIRQTPGSPNQLTTMALYRYVQPGDTTTMPAFWTAGSTYWSYMVWEISGVTGTWADDFLSVHAVPAPNSNGAAFPPFVQPCQSLALAATTSYDGNSNPSYSGSWILDEAQNNSGNFGSTSGAHRFMSSQDVIDGAPTQATSQPQGALVISLCDSGVLPTGQPYVRSKSIYSGNGAPTTFDTGCTPVVGNLWIAHLNWDRGAGAAPTIGSGWTQYATAAGNGHTMIFGLYRYVQGGDTSVIPALTTSGTDFFSVTVTELSGGFTGTFGTDHVSDKTGSQSSGTSPFATTADTTTGANQFALLAFANYNATAIGNVSGTGWANEAYVDGSNYGTWGVAEALYPSSSSSVSGTVTPTTNDWTAYIQSIFNGATGGLTVNAAITESMSLTDTTVNTDNEPGAVTEAMGLTDSVSVATSTPPAPMPLVVVIA